MAKKRILVIEDDEDIFELMRYNLEKESYIVKGARSAESALTLMKNDVPDLICLDLMLPGIDGFDFFRTVKSIENYSSIPIIIVSAKSDETVIVTGLEFGAEDFITKPFNVRVFVARVRAALRRRRRRKNDGPEVIAKNGLIINAKTHEVSFEKKSIDLTVSEFQLLFLLVAHTDRVWSRAAIIEHIKGDGCNITHRAIDVQMTGLRKKLGKAGEFIKTVRGVGYRFVAADE